MFKNQSIKATLMILAFGGVSACATKADPEPYLNFDCEQLRMLSETKGPIDPFAANRVGPKPQDGLTGDRDGLKVEDSFARQKQDDEARAIRAAYQQKGC